MLYLSVNEQRQFDRFHTLDYATVRSKLHTEPFQCEVVDVSLSGLQMRCGHPLAIGEEVELQIGLKKGEDILIPGKVCYTKVCDEDEEQFSTGLRFLPRTHEQRTAIAKYIHSAFMRECPIVRQPQKKAA